MGSPITFSGFNKIDFSVVLNAVMQQESQPLRTLEQRKSAFDGQARALRTLATKLAALESAAEGLGADTVFRGRTATVTDSTRLSVAPTSTTPVGTYDVVVQELARAQVTGTTSSHADTGTTAVATGGSLTIGGVAVSLSGSVTLNGLADAINATANIGVAASVVQSGTTSYQLVLTGKTTGSANAFSVVNSLTGGTGVTFGANSVAATNASVLVNNITTVSATNVVEGAIPGASLTLVKKDAATTVTVTVEENTSGARAKFTTFVSAYNDLRRYVAEQKAAAAGGSSSGNLGRDRLLSSVMTELSSSLTASYAVGGTYTRLSEIGLGFTRTGDLSFDESVFTAAWTANAASVEDLVVGDGVTSGAMDVIAAALARYTDAGGLVSGAQSRTDEQIASVKSRITALEARLSVRRTSLQREYIAADLAMTRLNSQVASLSSLGRGYQLF